MGDFGRKLFLVFVSLSIISLFIVGLYYLSNEINTYRAYHNFCKDRPTFCYCGFDYCKFSGRISTSCTNGECKTTYDNNVLDLCALAFKLDDKEVIFDYQCNTIEEQKGENEE